MRVLAVCESPPTTDPVHGNGSTLISAKLLASLPPGFEVRLLYFADRPSTVDAETAERCARIEALPLRRRPHALAAQPFTHLPTATWQRSGANDRIVRAAAGSDLVYLHGLHTASVLRRLRTPSVVHEVDYWSQHWEQRSRGRRGAASAYDRMQASRARRLEDLIAANASAVAVVSPAEAAQMTRDWGRPVVAVPNGVDSTPFTTRGQSQPDLLVFAGTLDYPPNIEAASRLARQIYPLVRAARPRARLIIAGRRPGPPIMALAGTGIDIQPDVASMSDLFRRATLAVFPGTTGTGTKNTVSEALAAGTPVVASPESARNQSPGPHLLVAQGDEAVAREILRLLADPMARESAAASARAATGSLRTWRQAASEMAALWDAAAAPAVG